MTAALVADRPVDAKMAALGLLLILALINTTLHLIRVVSAVIVPVTDEAEADTDLVFTEELVLAAMTHKLCSSDMVE